MAQFLKVNCKYGAPMGRACYGTPEMVESKIRLFKVAINSGGYDDGGAYWGHGAPLYCAMDNADNYVQFIRAHNRNTARALLDIDNAMLAKPE